MYVRLQHFLYRQTESHYILFPYPYTICCVVQKSVNFFYYSALGLNSTKYSSIYFINSQKIDDEKNGETLSVKTRPIYIVPSVIFQI